MAGVRIVHATARNARFTIVERERPYSAPFACPPPVLGGCGSTHLFKTHHLSIDETGAAIVEEVLYRRIRHLLVLNGFSEANVVERPPVMGVGLGNRVIGLQHHIPIISGEGS